MVKRKEDRSHWVAVPTLTDPSTSNDTQVRPASTPYQIFQRDMSSFVRRDLQHAGKPTDVGSITRMVSSRWKGLSQDGRERYEHLARVDKDRFARESYQRDIAQQQRQERLRRERNMEIILEDDIDGGEGRRSTRRSRAAALEAKEKPQHGRSKKKKRPSNSTSRQSDGSDYDSDEAYQVKKRKQRKKMDDSEEEYEEESSSDSDSNSYSSSSTSPPKKTKKKKPTPEPPKKTLTQKQIQAQELKKQKQIYMEQRQEELKEEKSIQAKRRLDFLLKQSDIFRHFGAVKEDQGRYTRSKSKASDTKSFQELETSRRNQNATVDDDELDGDNEVSSKTIFLTSQPSTLGANKGKMRPYQLEGLNWMIGLQEHGVNGILADEMGLGKTLQSISILVYMQEFQHCEGPHLIVVPKSTLSNWMNEIATWAPNLKAVRFHGTKEEREHIVQNVLKPGLGPTEDSSRDWNVCVTTYELCNIDKNVLNKFMWRYLIIDEAHRLKNEASAFSKTIRTFETKYRLLLTGTPLQNNLHELWALLNFLVPDVFASSEQFDDWFNLDIDDAEAKNNLISQLHKILRPFMLRRLKADVEKTLPPKHETILYTGMSSIQKKLYKDILLRDVDLLQGKNSSGGGGNRTAILNIVMQLRKCAGHPYLFPGIEDRSLPPLGEHLVSNCGKMVLLDKLLQRLQERGHRVLLFTQMTRILDILEDYLVMRKFKYCRIDGNTSYDIREESIEVFNKPNSEKFMFLLSTRAGGLGINLQTADVVILYDSDWNPQADLQAQDRAHRIGQKRPVQVFRLVTEHTIEEKVVERAQQKLKLDAMVVQQGRLKDKDKLSRDDLLDAVRFGADKVFKSKDSSITDDDIDLILDIGRKKTQELNEKLQKAEKGDMLDFKLDGGGMSAQTFEGVDYSQKGKDLAQIKAAQAQAELMGILDIGKRERRTVANYNENQLYRQQVSVASTPAREKKKKEIRLPKFLRLPRLEEWQMFDRDALQSLQEEEEKTFRTLTEELNNKDKTDNKDGENSIAEGPSSSKPKPSIDLNNLPPLLNEEKLEQKRNLLAEGFSDWQRPHYMAFVRASAKYGRSNYAQIAKEVGKPISLVQDYANRFWDESFGKVRISENEYEKVVKNIERGEKKLAEIEGLQGGTAILISLFDNPWLELEFTHVNCKDKLYTLDEDRHLLCWAHKYGYGQWGAIKMAIRRSQTFRFDYFFKSLPSEALGRRCEQLMRAAEREVEQLEKEAREGAGLIEEDVEIKLPTFKEAQEKKRAKALEEYKSEERRLEISIEEIESQMEQIQNRLKVLNEFSKDTSLSNSSLIPGEFPEDILPDLVNFVAKSGFTGINSLASEFSERHPGQVSKRQISAKIDEVAKKEKRVEEGDTRHVWYIQEDFKHLLDVDTLRYLRNQKKEGHLKKNKRSNRNGKGKEKDEKKNDAGANGPEGFVPFPEYDGKEPPKENKKAFTHFCYGTRREIKNSLEPHLRKDKHTVNKLLKKRWLSLTDSQKVQWNKWEEWDKKRYSHHLTIHETQRRKKRNRSNDDKRHGEERHEDKDRSHSDSMQIPKRNKMVESNASMSRDFPSIPKKRR